MLHVLPRFYLVSLGFIGIGVIGHRGVGLLAGAECDGLLSIERDGVGFRTAIVDPVGNELNIRGRYRIAAPWQPRIENVIEGPLSSQAGDQSRIRATAGPAD